MEENINLDSLEKACEPLFDWLRQNKADPHMSIIMDAEGVAVVRTEGFVPSKKKKVKL